MLLIFLAITDCAMYITIKTSTGMTIETSIENSKYVFILCTKMFFSEMVTYIIYTNMYWFYAQFLSSFIVIRNRF